MIHMCLYGSGVLPAPTDQDTDLSRPVPDLGNGPEALRGELPPFYGERLHRGSITLPLWDFRHRGYQFNGHRAARPGELSMAPAGVLVFLSICWTLLQRGEGQYYSQYTNYGGGGKRGKKACDVAANSSGREKMSFSFTLRMGRKYGGGRLLEVIYVFLPSSRATRPQALRAKVVDGGLVVLEQGWRDWSRGLDSSNPSASYPTSYGYDKSYNYQPQPSPSVAACGDQHNLCSEWAKNNQCVENSGYMLEMCPQSCRAPCPQRPAPSQKRLERVDIGSRVSVQSSGYYVSAAEFYQLQVNVSGIWQILNITHPDLVLNITAEMKKRLESSSTRRDIDSSLTIYMNVFELELTEQIICAKAVFGAAGALPRPSQQSSPVGSSRWEIVGQINSRRAELYHRRNTPTGPGRLLSWSGENCDSPEDSLPQPR
ncbi:hypothetical protein Bbelb_387520 [Branchiostoma belcheri]|nr:hypothetical protein Bbelb_387520 [Branchiostoma belcheri]